MKLCHPHARQVPSPMCYGGIRRGRCPPSVRGQGTRRTAELWAFAWVAAGSGWPVLTRRVQRHRGLFWGGAVLGVAVRKR